MTESLDVALNRYLAKENKRMLPDNQFIDVWDACSDLGYAIPWAEWKAHGIYPFNPLRARVGGHTGAGDPIVVQLLHAIPATYSPPPEAALVTLEDYICQATGPDWSRILKAILHEAHRKGVVQALKGPYDSGEIVVLPAVTLPLGEKDGD